MVQCCLHLEDAVALVIFVMARRSVKTLHASGASFPISTQTFHEGWPFELSVELAEQSSGRRYEMIDGKLARSRFSFVSRTAGRNKALYDGSTDPFEHGSVRNLDSVKLLAQYFWQSINFGVPIQP